MLSFYYHLVLCKYYTLCIATSMSTYDKQYSDLKPEYQFKIHRSFHGLVFMHLTVLLASDADSVHKQRVMIGVILASSKSFTFGNGGSI